MTDFTKNLLNIFPPRFPRFISATESKGSRFKLVPKKLLPTLPSLLGYPEIPLIHRDLSWLQFNERVLEQARPTSQNLPCERVKFLAISAANQDEFFMIRFASLGRDILFHRQHPEELKHLERIRNLILESVAKFGARQSEILDFNAAELHNHDLRIVIDPRETEEAFELGQQIFNDKVLPELSAPHTFSYRLLSQLQNLQMAVVFPDGLWFYVPMSLPPMFSAAGKSSGRTHFFFLDTLLLTYLGLPFQTREAPGILRLTRDADVSTDLEELGTEPTPDVVRETLRARDQGRPVRLQYGGNFSPDLLEQSRQTLGLTGGQILPAPTSLCLHGLWKVVDDVMVDHAGASKLVYPQLDTFMPEPFHKPETLFDCLRERDYLLHHPFDSFDAFVTWMKTACYDPKVESIELTIYRLGNLSPIVPFLKEAAAHKRIRILIELRARFDESNNLALAEELSKAGVEVNFGFGKLKLHAKIALVTRIEDGNRRFYTHLSTGNYNARTAKQYTDLAVLTSNPEIGNDARLFFDAVFEGRIPHGFKRLVLAPTNLHKRLLSLIQGEIKSAQEGKPARIVAKVNALVDEQVIASLYRASQFGVKIDLIVRGPCSLIPGVEGLSKNVRVISIIDRFLEHSRFYYFESSRQMYFSSADWMPRNFFKRLEIAFPVLDERIFKYMEQYVLPTHLGDTVKARELTAQGTWKKRIPRLGASPLRAQFRFIELSKDQYRGTPLE
jgi:polyphosphate kinase